ncbi:hypothetical protein CH381_12590 [Leptospira sp. mixed culture ATI2-C-A1]|nr:hypothetical protein CH381_12590 [Leptospira sp. mixed culture ATI2-C-A1]
MSEDEDILTYFQSIVIILLNLVPKKVDPGLNNLIIETGHKNHKIANVNSAWMSFNESARHSLSAALDFGQNIYITIVSKIFT